MSTPTLSIHFVNMAQATGIKEKGKKPRPVVLLKNKDGKAVVCQVTSRMKNDYNYAHLNNYKVHGFVDCGISYTIDRKYINNKSFVRDCTKSEYISIMCKAKKFGLV